MSIEIIFAIAGLMALTLILLMAMFARLYRKARDEIADANSWAPLGKGSA